MAETLRELVVALSLDSSNFSRNMRTINQQIKEAESTFRLAGAGVQNYEKTIAGTEAKLSMLGQKLTQQQRAVEQYSRALVAANDKLKENYDRHQDYTQRLEQAKARQEDLHFEVEAATYAYENYRDSLGETDFATIAAKQNLERYQEEYADATADIAVTTSGTVITNPGSVYSEPILTVTGSGNITLMVGMAIVELENISGSIVIDSVLQEAYQGTTLMNDHMNGEFPKLKPGANAISWTGTVTKVVVRPNWRYL